MRAQSVTADGSEHVEAPTLERDFAKEAIAAIRRNQRETLLFYIERFRDQDLGHIRIAVPDKAGGLKLTGKGITVTRELLPQFADAFQRLADELRAVEAGT